MMSGLGIAYHELGVHDKALEMHESTLAMRLRTIPEEHISIADSMNNLATTYRKLGMHDKALEMHESTSTYSSSRASINC